MHISDTQAHLAVPLAVPVATRDAHSAVICVVYTVPPMPESDTLHTPVGCAGTNVSRESHARVRLEVRALPWALSRAHAEFAHHGDVWVPRVAVTPSCGIVCVRLS